MASETLKIGSSVPAFSNLLGVDGKHYSLEDFRKCKILVLVFSCNHCPYVQAYEDRMKDFQQEYGPRGVQLVAINSNETKNYPEDNFDEMVRRAKRMGFNFPYLRDDDQRVAGAFGATHTPEFYVFSAEGEDGRTGALRLSYHGKMDDNYQNPSAVKRRYVQEAVDALLAGKPVAEPETHSIGCTIKWSY
jgi:peroxiredoxin